MTNMSKEKIEVLIELKRRLRVMNHEYKNCYFYWIYRWISYSMEITPVDWKEAMEKGGMTMEYKEILDECEVRAEAYRIQDAVWNLTHEEKCASAIKNLLARAESAEADNERLRQAMKPNCLLCESVHKDNGNCTEIGGFCTAVPAAYCPLIPRLMEENDHLKDLLKEAEEKK